MLFGPVFVVAAIPVMYAVIRIYKTLLSIKKEHEERKKELT